MSKLPLQQNIKITSSTKFKAVPINYKIKKKRSKVLTNSYIMKSTVNK